MLFAPDRRFATMLGLSFLLHAVLFAGLSWQRQTRPAVPLTIFATLRQIVAPPAGAAAETPRPVPAALPPKVRPSPSLAAQHSMPLATRTAEPTTVSAPSPVAESAAASPAPPAPAAAPAAAVAAAAPGAGAVRTQSELLAAYRQRLTELFARHQEYPRIAAMRGWEGEVRLRLKVARKGNLLGIQLDHSSGFDVLDQHALAMLEQLTVLPPLPDGLEADEIQLVVPVNYKLKKTT